MYMSHLNIQASAFAKLHVVSTESELKEITSVFAEIIHDNIGLADLTKKKKCIYVYVCERENNFPYKLYNNIINI